MHITFIIDEKYLAAHILRCHSFSSDCYRDEIVEFKNLAWDKSAELYQIISKKVMTPRDLDDFSVNTEALSYLDELTKTEIFQTLLNQTLEFKKETEKEWENNFESTLDIISELTGLKTELDGGFKIYVTHPSLRNGRNVGDNTILWGTTDEWPNYSTVYLWHEILHSVLPKNELGHAVIELISDEELRVRLNGGSYPPFVGHKNLEEIKNNLLPRWREYVKGKNLNIKVFLKNAGI